MTVDYDLDPDAIEWARGKVQWLIDKADRFADQGGENAEQWRRLARIVHMQLLGSGEGCVITPLDTRLPEMKAAWFPSSSTPAKPAHD